MDGKRKISSAFIFEFRDLYKSQALSRYKSWKSKKKNPPWFLISNQYRLFTIFRYYPVRFFYRHPPNIKATCLFFALSPFTGVFCPCELFSSWGFCFCCCFFKVCIRLINVSWFWAFFLSFSSISYILAFACDSSTWNFKISCFSSIISSIWLLKRAKNYLYFTSRIDSI